MGTRAFASLVLTGFICASLCHEVASARIRPKPTPPPTPTVQGQILWQLPMDGPYSSVRPAMGPDGTVYAIDVYRNLYAVSASGILKWKVALAGNKGLAVGSDGTVYTASEDDVRAYSPDGTVKWVFAQVPRAFVMLGLSVGPDGNLYGVGINGLGAFSLTPTGLLRWANSEPYARPIVDYGEIVFGANPTTGKQQMIFYANSHIRAIGLDGQSLFTLAAAGQPSVDKTDGSIYAAGAKYSASGALLWNIGGTTANTTELGPDGSVYMASQFGTVPSYTTSGALRWQYPSFDFQNPNVDPSNTVVLYGVVGSVLSALSPSTGKLLYSIALPIQSGAFYSIVDTKMRFTTTGGTAYFVTSGGANAMLTALKAK